MVEFNFITTSSDPKLALKDAHARQLIRRTATRATRSSKAKEASLQHHDQSNAVQEISQRGGMTRFRTRQGLPGLAGENTSTNSILAMSPLMVQIAFWDPVVEPLGGQAWTLLHYYRFLFRARSWAVNGKQDWFTFVIQDAASTHATLALVSLNRDLEQGSSISLPTLHHRAKAISLVRERLNTHNVLPDDSIIGAVALLAITEGLEGHFALSVAHFQALAKLVSLRGGFQQLRKNEALSRLVAWSDFCHTSSSKDHYHLPGVSNSEYISLAEEQTPQLSKGNQSFQDSIRQVLSPESTQMIKLLATVPQQSPTEETSPGTRQTVSRLIYSINQILLSLLQAPDTDSIPNPPNLLTKFLHDAAYVYIALVLRQMPRRTVVVIERGEKLLTALERTRNYSSWQSLPQDAVRLVRLWACVIYYCSLLPQDRDPWLTSEIRTLIHKFKITDILSLEDRLSHISWVKGFGQEDLRKLVS